jgi:hypothetical protein
VGAAPSHQRHPRQHLEQEHHLLGERGGREDVAKPIHHVEGAEGPRPSGIQHRAHDPQDREERRQRREVSPEGRIRKQPNDDAARRQHARAAEDRAACASSLLLAGPAGCARALRNSHIQPANPAISESQRARFAAGIREPPRHGGVVDQIRDRPPAASLLDIARQIDGVGTSSWPITSLR